MLIHCYKKVKKLAFFSDKCNMTLFLFLTNVFERYSFMGRLYYFLAMVVISIIGTAGASSCVNLSQEALMQAQTPEAMQAIIEQSVNYPKLYAIYAITGILTLAATYFRLANAGMNKFLTLLMFVPLVNFFFMIFLFFKKGE